MIIGTYLKISNEGFRLLLAEKKKYYIGAPTTVTSAQFST